MSSEAVNCEVVVAPGKASSGTDRFFSLQEPNDYPTNEDSLVSQTTNGTSINISDNELSDRQGVWWVEDTTNPACWNCLGPVNPCKLICVRLRATESKCCAGGNKSDRLDFAQKLASESPLTRAVHCFIALTITTAIEACVATVIASFTDTIRVVPLLSSFIAVISAVSGNIGLICSASTIRALQAGFITPLSRNDWPWDLLRNKEFVKSNVAAVFMAIYTAVLVGCVGAILGVVFKDALGGASLPVFAFVLVLCQFLAGCMAGLIGNTIPLYFHRDGVDPCTVAGPGETALQDSVGTVLLFALGGTLLAATSS